MLDIVLSIVMLAALALIAGAVFLWRRGDRKRAGLMGFLAVIMLVNVAIWTIPTVTGETPAALATVAP